MVLHLLAGPTACTGEQRPRPARPQRDPAPWTAPTRPAQKAAHPRKGPCASCALHPPLREGLVRDTRTRSAGLEEGSG